MNFVLLTGLLFTSLAHAVSPIPTGKKLQKMRDCQVTTVTARKCAARLAWEILQIQGVTGINSVTAFLNNLNVGTAHPINSDLNVDYGAINLEVGASGVILEDRAKSNDLWLNLLESEAPKGLKAYLPGAHDQTGVFIGKGSIPYSEKYTVELVAKKENTAIQFAGTIVITVTNHTDAMQNYLGQVSCSLRKADDTSDDVTVNIINNTAQGAVVLSIK